MNSADSDPVGYAVRTTPSTEITATFFDLSVSEVWIDMGEYTGDGEVPLYIDYFHVAAYDESGYLLFTNFVEAPANGDFYTLYIQAPAGTSIKTVHIGSTAEGSTDMESNSFFFDKFTFCPDPTCTGVGCSK